MKPLVYVAGPISGAPFACVRESLPAFRSLLKLGAIPFMPQFSVIAEMIEPFEYEAWMAYDFDVIRRADAVVRLPGVSPGADREMELAKELNLPVWLYDNGFMQAALRWFQSRRAEDRTRHRRIPNPGAADLGEVCVADPEAGDVTSESREEPAATTDALFQVGDFTLASGQKSSWKVECDALTDDDWAGLATIAVGLLPSFGAVWGVPRGGLPFADALRAHVTEGPMLLADDVWTTGGSMRRYRGAREAIGVVAFARGPVEPWVTAVWRFSGVLVQPQPTVDQCGEAFSNDPALNVTEEAP